MTHILPYGGSVHRSHLVEWLRARDSYVPGESEMPKIGYIGYNSGHAVAIGFLRMVEGGYAQLDSYTTNPAATPEERHVCLDLITTQLIGKAKELDIKGILCTTRDRGILERAINRHGFKLLPEQTIALSLTERS
jgi:hypothetical protein